MDTWQKIRETNSKKAKIDDVCFLVNYSKNESPHAAVYVGFGLYLSVYGAGGNLEFSRLPDMKRDYGASHCVWVRLRE